jgi:2-polyprenyl-6-methoxyphenol hydroxylase-like FAD-dependent oxidoreductase
MAMVHVDELPTTQHNDQAVHHTQCCIVGGGPGGTVLALLLARSGIAVRLLEAHHDFEREFRGDTIHPSVMEIMDQLGLADRLLELRHTKIPRLTLQTASGPITPVDFSRLKTRFPYITMLPQSEFLQFITAEAQRYHSFQLVMGARVEELIAESDVVRGVRYREGNDWHEVRAHLIVGADGRFSRLRRLAGLEPITTSPPMDVLWFKLPRSADDPEEAFGRTMKGQMLVCINRFDYWQIGYVIPKGNYGQLHASGIEALRQAIAELAPEFADRVSHLHDWKQVSLLSVASDRLPRWYKPGLLLIGDAAHIMSPVAGVGINYAIQDAVVAANLLTEPLKAGQVRLSDLRAVQRRREWPTRFMQAIQTVIQKRILASALSRQQPFTPPRLLGLTTRIPLLRDLPACVIAFGIWPVRVKNVV